MSRLYRIFDSLAVICLMRSFRTGVDDVKALVSTVAALAREASAATEYLMEKFEARPTEIDVFAA